MTGEEKYKEFVNIVCEMLGFNKPIDILRLCQITSDFIRPYEMKIKELEKEKEQLKQQVSYLENNLRVARKDREYLKNDIAKGLKEFIKERPFSSLRLMANLETIEENDRLKADLERVEELVKTVKTCPFNVCHNCEAECKLNKSKG